MTQQFDEELCYEKDGTLYCKTPHCNHTIGQHSTNKDIGCMEDCGCKLIWDAPFGLIDPEILLVESSNIRGYKYNKETKLFTLYFINGSAYEYENVDSVNVELFSVASSKGKYFIENIKNQYKATKIKEPMKKPVTKK